MGQFFGPDNFPALVKASTASVTLATTNMGRQTRLTIGGQQYPVTVALALSTAASGLGGIDTGSVAANTLYYVYACVNTSGVVGLVASLSNAEIGPFGFTGRYKYLGKFKTFAGSTNIYDVVTQGYVQENSEWAAFTPTGTLTTTTTYTGRWRRVKTDAEIKFRVTFGGVNTDGAAAFIIPTATIGTVDISNHLNGAGIRGVPVGEFEFDDVSSVAYAGLMVLNSGAIQQVFPILNISAAVSSPTSMNTVDTSVNRPVIVASGDAIMAIVRVPIVEFVGLYS